MSTNTDISSEFPFASNYLEVFGSKMHYVDEGEGEPVVFLHGNPTSSYLWRNILPYLKPYGRCIALDLIGMGRSDKPSIDYYFSDHVRYVEEFIAKLGLHNITLVIHDWGSALGFHYARRQSKNIRAISFMEAIIKPMQWSDFEGAERVAFKIMRSNVVGPALRWLSLGVMNGFIKQVLPKSVVRPLTEAEMSHYIAPYPTIQSRKPLHQWLSQVPVAGNPTDVWSAVEAYREWLGESTLPKLMFFAKPGMAIKEEGVAWCKRELKNLTVVDLGEGIHFLQEDHPHRIGTELQRWFQNL